MKRYIRTASAAAESKKAAMKEAGHALQAAIKSYPERLPATRFVDIATHRVEEITPRILSSVKAVSTEHCFVTVHFNVLVEGSRSIIQDIVEYAIDSVASDYPDYEFEFGQYGSFRGSDLGAWIIRKEPQ